MNKQSKRVLGLFVRYFSLLLIGVGNLYIFYKFLTPLTIRSVSSILSIFSRVSTNANYIIFKGTIIHIVPACVAGAAFFLLFLLLFSTAEIKPLKRFYALITSLAILFIFNILRIISLAYLIKTPYFQSVHWIFWHLLSTILVVLIWIFIIKIYKIKDIPVYSDIVYLKGLIKKPKEKTKRKKKH